MSTNNLCAIHQPNFFPRLSTLAKLYMADTWVVLDNVQYNGRDYQNRCRLGSLDSPAKFRWLSLPVHRASGRSTLISDVRLVDRRSAYHLVSGSVEQRYRSSPHWTILRKELQPIFTTIRETDNLGLVAEVSTVVLLRLLGWHGQVKHGSTLVSRTGRSDRLADLVHAIGGTEYLCGTGGRRYLDAAPFEAYRIPVRWFEPPTADVTPLSVWSAHRQVSALWPLLAYGVDATRDALEQFTTSDR